MRTLDIEKLLQWAYLDELCKGGDTATTNQWDLVLLMGARRERRDDLLPAYFGEAHRDAITIHRAVQQLPAPAPALILKHATLQTQPDWLPGPIRVGPTYGAGRKQPHVVGENKGKITLFGTVVNKYTLGSYCPLRWVPTRAEINAARLEWRCWWDALFVLAASLRLSEHVATGPAALVTPWNSRPLKAGRVLQSQRAI
jgi:hypothetical protein